MKNSGQKLDKLIKNAHENPPPVDVTQWSPAEREKRIWDITVRHLASMDEPELLKLFAEVDAEKERMELERERQEVN